MTEPLHIIGGGMAGSEAAWQAAQMGVPVVLHEMRPQVKTFAHRTGDFAEMVCSNSFRSDDDEQNAVGLLHWEMRAAQGLILQAAEAHRLPAGGALAVDRDPFAAYVTARLKSHSLISTSYDEVTELPSSGTLDRGHRPPDFSGACRKHPPCDRRRKPRLLRRHRPHRLCRHRGHVRGLDAKPLRQGRDAGRTDRLHELPDDPRPILRLHRRPSCRRQNRIPRRRNRRLFRRLPADRGHGRTRPRDAAPRPDEAPRPDQCPRPRQPNPTPWSNCARTTNLARSTTSSAFRPR